MRRKKQRGDEIGSRFENNYRGYLDTVKDPEIEALLAVSIDTTDLGIKKCIEIVREHIKMNISNSDSVT